MPTHPKTSPVTAVPGALAQTILKTLRFAEDHPDDPNAPKFISEARGFCKEHGFKLVREKPTSPSSVPPWRMKPLARHTPEPEAHEVNGFVSEGVT